MRETGVILSVTGRRMTVRLTAARPEFCEKCRACEAFGEDKGMKLDVPAIEGLKAGDRVSVEVPEANPWVSMIFVLALPIIGLVAGLALGSRWPWWINALHLDGELAGALLGIILASLLFVVARMVDRRYRGRIRVTRADDAVVP